MSHWDVGELHTHQLLPQQEPALLHLWEILGLENQMRECMTTKGLQFPKALQGLSPPELVGIKATMKMQEVGLVVPRRHHVSHTDNEHIPLISNCGGYILFCN